MRNRTYVYRAPVGTPIQVPPEPTRDPDGNNDGQMDGHFTEGFVSLQFFNDAEYITPVTPTGGTVTVEASEDDQSYAEIPNGTDIDVTDGNYARPAWLGKALYARATETAPITGATHYQLTILRK